MKRIKMMLIALLILITLTGCGTKKYQGYWCNYAESVNLIVLLNDDITTENRKKIETTVDGFENVSGINYYSKQDYINELGGGAGDLEIYGTYVISFSSLDSIGDYATTLRSIDGIKSIEQSNAKKNMSLYSIDKKHKFTFTNSDEALEEDIIEGKYNLKNGVITFTPTNKDKQTTLLYIKDGHLCGDTDCNIIYSKSDKTCSSIPQEK